MTAFESGTFESGMFEFAVGNVLPGDFGNREIRDAGY